MYEDRRRKIVKNAREQTDGSLIQIVGWLSRAVVNLEIENEHLKSMTQMNKIRRTLMAEIPENPFIPGNNQFLEMAYECIDRQSLMSNWEVDFINSITEDLENNLVLNDGAKIKLEEIWEKLY